MPGENEYTIKHGKHASIIYQIELLRENSTERRETLREHNSDIFVLALKVTFRNQTPAIISHFLKSTDECVIKW